MLKTLFTIVFIFSCVYSQAEPYVYSGGSNLIGKWLYILEDTSNSLSAVEAYRSPNFAKSEKSVQNFDISNSTYWIKISITNKSPSQLLFLEVGDLSLQ